MPCSVQPSVSRTATLLRRLILPVVGVLWAGPLSAAQAEGGRLTPLQISLGPGVELVPHAETVAGLRLSLPWGRTENLYGFDVGLYNEIRHDFVGLEAGLVNRMPVPAARREPAADPSVCGLLQAGLLVNWNERVMLEGVQIAGLANFNPELAKCHGIQIAGVMNGNETDADRNEGASFYGLQIAGLANRNRLSGGGGGIQIAGLGNWNNGGTEFTGLQIAGVLGNGGYLSGLAEALRKKDATDARLDNTYPSSIRGAQISVSAAAALYVVAPPLLLSAAWIVPKNTADNLTGLQVAACGVNDVMGSCEGVQIGGLFNLVRRNGDGLQVSCVNMVGWQDRARLDPENPRGFFGDEYAFNGIQLGAVNLNRGRFGGVQLGVVNVTDRLSGVQIGAINWVQRGPVRCFPILNAAF